ncbi:MAG TPA: hypothetical protein VGN84_07725 [Solirubrobacterales bacterium]|nr:hypothetical protein [Solirubrobacterales bacterium]
MAFFFGAELVFDGARFGSGAVTHDRRRQQDGRLAFGIAELDRTVFGEGGLEAAGRAQLVAEGAGLARVGKLDRLLEAVAEPSEFEGRGVAFPFVGCDLAFKIGAFQVFAQELAFDPLIAHFEANRLGVDLLGQGDVKVIRTVDEGLFAGFVQPFPDRAPVALFVAVVDGLGVDPRFELAVGEGEGFGVGGALGGDFGAGFGLTGVARRARFALLRKCNARTESAQRHQQCYDETYPLHSISPCPLR